MTNGFRILTEALSGFEGPTEMLPGIVSVGALLRVVEIQLAEAGGRGPNFGVNPGKLHRHLLSFADTR